jgi:hypothetical protein
MSVSIEQDRITPAERIDLVVEVFAPENVQVGLPSLKGDPFGLAIRDRREYPAKATGTGQLWRQEYRLDATVIGEHTIPKLTARFTGLRLGTDAAIEGEVTTDAFTVVVESLLPSDVDLTAFRDVKGPVPLGVSPTTKWSGYAVGVLAVIVVSVWVFVWLSRQGRQTHVQDVIPAHEWALDQLRRLTDEQLIERGLVREFYFRLSMIVRQYVNLQFCLMAVERTTEELARKAQDGAGLSVDHQQTLVSFLTACDRVKFARHTPRADEIDGVLDTASSLVSQPVGSVTEGRATP